MDPETFPIFKDVPWLVHGFTVREEGLALKLERTQALALLEERHQRILQQKGVSWTALQCGEQVHGNRMAVISRVQRQPVAGIDGLITATAGVALGIHVADCCAVFLLEKNHRLVGLLHSGRKGTEANIVHEALDRMRALHPGKPLDVTAALGPCIHGCCYDVDFVAQIERQLADEGVKQIWRHPDCTGCHLDRYYSYRKEMGKTGRMLAFMMIKG